MNVISEQAGIARAGTVVLPGALLTSLISSLMLSLCLGLSPLAACAEDKTAEEDLALIYGDKSIISVATGSAQSLRRAPAVATVITAADIEATGATSIDDILETVPGLHVSHSTVLNEAIYTIRGVRNGVANPQVLMLINGIPLIDAYSGDRGLIFAGMPVENIARIEVIRGPGSALYGADAFAGVINIITKNAKDIDGSLAGVRLGSFQSRDAWLLHGGKLGSVDVAASLQYSKTDGPKRLIETDAQTGFDKLFGTHASLAPGFGNYSRNALDGMLDFSYQKWRMRFAVAQREIGPGIGLGQAVDPKGWASSLRVNADIIYNDHEFAKDWDLEVNTGFTHYKENASLVLFPPGAFGGAFKDGFIGGPARWERHGKLNAALQYSGFSQHQVRLGMGIAKEDLYKIREVKNFNPDNSPINVGAFSDLKDVSDTIPYIQPHSRVLHYLYAQDEWRFAQDWTLTSGLRMDRYSDFGGTINPRLALVWDVDYNLTAKLLYGSAFRAPAFEDLYTINNPIFNGNPALQAEKMRTSEAALNWQATPKLQFGVNLFYYQMTDIIRLNNNFINENGGSNTGRGLEIEATWDLASDWRLAGNLAYQHSIDEVTQKDPGLSPRRHAYMRADWSFQPGWLANAQINHVAGRMREPGDSRPPVKDYTTLDLTIGTHRKSTGWNITCSIRNLFNTDAREPSPFTAPFINLPNDIPLAGRSIFLQLSHKL